MLLRRQGLDLIQLVVDDRQRNQHHLIDPALLEGADQVVQQPIPGRPQLPGPGTAALHIPLEVEPLSHQVADVLAQHQLVHRVVAEAAADEHHAASTRPGTDRPEADVQAAENVIRREPVAVKY